MKTGTVKIWQKERGYGYITPDEGGDDVFVHFNGIDMDGFKTLIQSEKVAYVLVQGYKSYQAAQVRPLSVEAADV
ncbi:cold-shock protein [Leuconostoc mesenteroides]|uniref:cold-shock protein n=1 Tax=Leuconostoc mesenteroides TaxID=1245 RepID=UPI000A052F24|nr:cold-shock protein [Leuconostoc mesenteroides]MBZ1517160.1 cold-shock protein [Leuconostoc mesenteroides]MBZ1539865.1 cold-shock protein [Leuconostoc mesenteroides]MCP9301844.1 cold-shock protein [Leuconostoc mesenteroides]MCP9326361.1 cold-shock protein [Leuconostoc mesenteroides]MCT3038903.1 cold-shock protein [Leuconostoc mesenteroides]